MASRGIPVSCEVDIYGALASDHPPTLLDINNTVPPEMITKDTDLMGATSEDLFMGFHCGKALFDAVKLLGVDDINVPLPGTMRYPGENPFELA